MSEPASTVVENLSEADGRTQVEEVAKRSVESIDRFMRTQPTDLTREDRLQMVRVERRRRAEYVKAKEEKRDAKAQ